MSPIPGLRRAFRATVVNPVSADRAEIYKPGYLTVVDGKVESISVSSDEENIVVLDDKIIIPGFVDVHVHLPQFGILGLGGGELLEWLDRYTYPEEARFADKEYAAKTSSAFFDAMLANGTTTASIYCSIHERATDIAFQTAKAKGVRAFIGKAMMDRNSPAPLLETREQSMESSIRLFEKWDGAESGRLRYVFSPRFAGSCSMELMRSVGEFANDRSARIQTHLSENASEVAWVRSLFPQFSSYTDIYGSAGLLGPRAIVGHCIHLDDSEVQALSKAGAAVAFCPCSNRTLRSGVMPYARLRSKGIRIGMGSDIAGAPTLSMFRQMGEALNIGLTPAAAFFHATLGGAVALGVDDVVGSLNPGKDADFVILRDGYTGPYNELEHTLSRMCYLGDQNLIDSVWIQGRQVYSRD